MIEWFKKHFIPHFDNDNGPHILRRRGIQGIIIFIVFVEMISFLSPVLSKVNMGGLLANVLPAVMSDLTNNERKSQNLSTLTVNPVLNESAYAKALDMATKGYFAHTSPEGKTPWYWLDQAGYRYQYAGENLAVNFNDSEDVTRAWMESPSHRANIVKENYTEVGTGVATGLYKERAAIFVVQVYANPMPKNVQNSQLQQSNIPVPKNIQLTEEKRSEVLGVETVTEINEPTVLQKAAASPRNTTNLFLMVIFGVVSLVLLFYILIRKRDRHLNILLNGTIALIIIFGVFLINFYISGHNTVILGPFNY